MNERINTKARSSDRAPASSKLGAIKAVWVTRAEGYSGEVYTDATLLQSLAADGHTMEEFVAGLTRIWQFQEHELGEDPNNSFPDVMALLLSNLRECPACLQMVVERVDAQSLI